MTAAKCPMCSKPVEAKYRPFCSKRCADLDLQKWLTGRYAVPATDDQSAEDAASDSPRGALFDDDED